MKMTTLTATLAALGLGLGASPVLGEDQPPKDSEAHTPAKSTAQGERAPRPQAADTSTSTRTSAEIMRTTQQAMTHIAAAEKALQQGQTAAARSALARSEAVLERLYDTPPLMAVLNEIDEAIASIGDDKQALKALDLAPLAATVRNYQAYMDPKVAAGIDDARASAKQGDARATEESLRLARNRVAVEIAFLPIEEAYVRVLAADKALEDGETERAARMLRNLPIVMTEVQVATPLVPVRFKLNAAALAAEEGNWKRSQTLIKEVTTELQNLEKQAKGDAITAEMSTLVDDVEALNRKLSQGTRPQPQAIRDIAQRTRDLGA